MQTQPWHSTEPKDPKVYHDNDSCATGNKVDPNKRESGTNDLPKCVECGDLDKGEVRNPDDNTANLGNNPDMGTIESTHPYSASKHFDDDRKDRSNDPGNPNNPSRPSSPSAPANPTDPESHDWKEPDRNDDWKSGNWDRTNQLRFLSERNL
jgi:hypothetical protein